MLVSVTAQNKSAYHINIKNGLPTNFTYQVIKDRFGYLWFATENGVVKYNGYELKTFNISNGLSKNDIWRLWEDKKGRIWLFTISDEIGYIHNDRYHKLTFEDTSINHIYTTAIENTKDGVAFITARSPGNRAYLALLCVEKNDTVKSYKILFRKDLVEDTTHYSDFVHKDGYGIVVIGQAIEKHYIENDSVHMVKLCDYKPNEIARPDSRGALYGNLFCLYEALTAKLLCTDIRTGKTNKIILPEHENQRITTLSFQDDKLHVLTNKCVFVYNEKMEVIKTVDITKSLPDFAAGSTVTSLLDDDFWGTTLSTTENGIFINCNKNNYKPQKNFVLPGYSYVGHSFDSSSYWWSKDKRTLHVIDKKNNSVFKHLPNKKGITQVVPYNGERSLLLTTDTMYWYYPKSNTVTHIFDGISKYQVREKTQQFDPNDDYIRSISTKISSVVFTSANSFSIITKPGTWSWFYFNKDSIYNATLLFVKLKSTTYDSKRKILFCYDDKNILLKTLPDGDIKHINKAILNSIGIKKLEKILIDSSGNIFIKDYDHLILFNPEKNKYQYILKDYILHNTSIYFYKNKLIVAGDFGVSFITINGPGSISQPYTELNTKKAQYNNLISSYVSNNNLQLHTDQGVYSLQIPPDNVSNTNEEAQKYRMAISANGNTNIIGLNDTILVHQKDYTLLLEVIKPSGVGKLSFRYRISGIEETWKELAGNEINAANLDPGKYYDISLKASDDIWTSNIITFKVRVIPYWWQTPLAKNLFLLLTLIFTIGLVALTVYLTRRILSRKHRQQKIQLELKNLNLALELKSIYAQINPHFIFNTLSTALYYIKKKKVDEAYNHITSFSDLLRAYIKSSRSKYITIEEEIENLTNYISLQQARFENKFEYSIIITNTIDTTKTFIPTLLLQPLVENAINHGLLPSENENGQLAIQFLPGDNNGDIVCTIDDNGIGRERSKQLKKEYHVKAESYGTDLIHELIDIFNKNENIYITLDYIDKQPPQQGTTVVINIKQKKS